MVPMGAWTTSHSKLVRVKRHALTAVSTHLNGSLQEQWLHHQQLTGVVEYRRRFIELMAPLTEVPEEIALAQCINGLKGEIKKRSVC